jgi:hypothetical protein
MPRPHYPQKGGAHVPAWSSPVPPPAHGKGNKESKRHAELQAEILRLRKALSDVSRGVGHGKASIPMVWIALGACCCGIVFILIAFMHRG